MQWEVGQGDRVGHRSVLDAVEDLLAQRLVKGAGHEVVLLGDAHLLGCLAEVRLVAWDGTVNPQLPENPLGPHVVRRLGLGQLRGPTSPEHRSTAQAIGDAGEADGHVRSPRKTPHLGSGHPGVRRRRRRRSQVHAGQVLDVLAQDIGPGVEDQDAVGAAAIADERMEREHRTERPTSDDDDVERSTIDTRRAGDRLVQAVAEVAAEHVPREIGVLGDRARHGRPAIPTAIGAVACRAPFNPPWNRAISLLGPSAHPKASAITDMNTLMPDR